MTNQPPMPDQMPPPDWREQRHAERWQRRQERHARGWGGGAWIGGVVLIFLGVVFLAQNMGAPLPKNWWAVFILIPAVASFSSAWTLYRRSGGMMTAGVRGGIVGGAILTLLAISFLIGLNWGRFWPVILILVGAAVLGGGIWRR